MNIFALNHNETYLIKPLWEELNKTHYANSNNWKQHFKSFTFEKRISSILKCQRFVVHVSSNQSEITGYVISSINKGIGEIDSIFVKKNFRDVGIGYQLIEAAVNWLKENGVNEIKIGIAEGNEHVMPFYEKLGFKKNMTIMKLGITNQ